MKPLPVNPTDPAVTGPDIFAKLVPMAAHEASSLYRCVGGTGSSLAEVLEVHQVYRFPATGLFIP